MVLPKFEEFVAPWEKDVPEGADPKEKLDLPALKRYVYGLMGDKDRAKTETETVTAERDTLKAAADAAAREGESEADRLKRENEELRKKAEKADEPDLEKLRLKVAIKKGLDEDAMTRLVGTTEEEMLADADKLLKNWKKADTEESGDEGDDEARPSVRPASKLRNPGDPKPDDKVFDADKLADEYQSRFGAAL